MCNHHAAIPPVAGMFDERSLDRRGFLRTAGVASLGLAGAGLVTGRAAAAEKSQNGWPALKSPDLDTDFAAGGVRFPPGVLAGDVAVILGRVAARFHAEVEALVDPGCWGHSYRKIGGGSTWSNHASATAIDCNAPEHPQGKPDTFSSAQVKTITEIVKECEGTVRWGGTYSGASVDDMHFEINVPPSDGSVAAVAAKFRGEPPPPGSDKPTLKEGAKGAAVTEAQELLIKHGASIKADGVFGAKTKATVIDFQKSEDLEADGIIGQKTWKALLA